MKLKLFSRKMPSGRCALLAKKLDDIAVLSGKGALLIAQDIFLFRHNESNPVVILLKDNSDLDEIHTICRECGVESFVVGE